MSIDGYVYMTVGATWPGGGARYLGPEVTDDCEEPNIDSGNLTWVCCNSSMCF